MNREFISCILIPFRKFHNRIHIFYVTVNRYPNVYVYYIAVYNVTPDRIINQDCNASINSSLLVIMAIHRHYPSFVDMLISAMYGRVCTPFPSL